MTIYWPPLPPSDDVDFSKDVDINADIDLDFDSDIELNVDKDININTKDIKLNEDENVAVAVVGVEAFGQTTFAELILDVTTTDGSSQIYADGLAVSS